MSIVINVKFPQNWEISSLIDRFSATKKKDICSTVLVNFKLQKKISKQLHPYLYLPIFVFIRHKSRS